MKTECVFHLLRLLFELVLFLKIYDMHAITDNIFWRKHQYVLDNSAEFVSSVCALAQGLTMEKYG